MKKPLKLFPVGGRSMSGATQAELLGFIGPRDRETDQAAVAAMVSILADIAAERAAP